MLSIGLSGSNLAGKGAVREIIERKFKTYSISLSDIMRQDFARMGKSPAREAMIEYANAQRKERGAGIFAERAAERAGKEGQKAEVVLFDSVRNVSEIAYLRDHSINFKFLFVDAPVELRYQRSLLRARANEEKTSIQQFKKNDEAESGKSGQAHVQQLAQCRDIADEVIINDESLEKLEEKVIAVIKRYLK